MDQMSVEFSDFALKKVYTIRTNSGGLYINELKSLDIVSCFYIPRYYILTDYVRVKLFIVSNKTKL